MRKKIPAGHGSTSITPARIRWLSSLVTLACLGASGSALADDWRVCLATAGNAQGASKHVHWAVTQPFEVSAIPDWQQQYEAAKPERYAFARGRGWDANEEGFSCSEAMPDFATAQARHSDIAANFAERRDLGDRLGVPFSWEDWSWRPAAGGNPATAAQTAGDTDATPAGEDDASSADDAQAVAERERREAAEAEARRQKELADAKAEQDRQAREKAERDRQQAAKAERDRLAAEEAKRKASTDTDANRCVTSPSLRQNDTFQGNTAAYVTNGCGTPVDVRICLMTESKGWNCGMTFGLQPQASWSWSSFHASGPVFMDARVQGSGRSMASP